MLAEVQRYQSELEACDEVELKRRSSQLQQKAKTTPSVDSLLPEAYALVKEAVHRVLTLQAFDEQLMAAVAIHQGKLAEMQTGEGKTLAAVFPAYLNALSGCGVHVLTFNDYLARRDAQWMGPVYQYLGLQVGFVQEGMTVQQRQQAYRADITYLTAKEAGFDFLRDGLCYRKEDIVQRNFHYVIVDEADSILIDEARVPLILAGTSEDPDMDNTAMARLVLQLKADSDIAFDEYARSVSLTDKGLKHAEKLLHCQNLYAKNKIELLTRLNCALHAQFLLNRDQDYIVRQGKVELVDEFTGRVADKRRWPDGLQAALEAKENLKIQSKGNILNSITLQHFIRLYPRLGAMTATAQPAAEEFNRFYQLVIAVIPSHKPCIRQDHPDVIFPNRQAKNTALIAEIDRVYRSRRPILVGTQSVKESEQLAGRLKELGIPCEVLNAKHDESEAAIIAQAGRLGAVTISTNMAGRGTDIRLGGEDEQEKAAVNELGGLYVIGTNKHDSARIDNQLRGRSGRQGDPGESRFFISLEDEIFIKYRLKDLLASNFRVHSPSGQVEDPKVIFEINRIQRIVEGQNLEIKKTLFEYSEMVETQRRFLFEKRSMILQENSAMEFCADRLPDKVNQLLKLIDQDALGEVCRRLFLFHMDRAWSQYLADIADIREGIHWRRFGGQKPVREFIKLSVERFDELQMEIEERCLQTFEQLEVRQNRVDFEKAGIKTPSSTWTYMINDDPFDGILNLQIVGNIGMALGAGLWWPLLFLVSWWKKIKTGKKRGLP